MSMGTFVGSRLALAISVMESPEVFDAMIQSSGTTCGRAGAGYSHIYPADNVYHHLVVHFQSFPNLNNFSPTSMDPLHNISAPIC